MQNANINGPLDRSNPIEAKGRKIIEKRMEEIMNHPSERIASLENLNWEQLIAFAQGKPTQEAIDKSRTIVNILSDDTDLLLEEIEECEKETYKAGSKMSVEIEKCTQIYAYVRSTAITLEDQNHSAAGYWLDQYRECTSGTGHGYIIKNHEEAKEKWEGRAQSSNPKEIEKWKANYIYSLLMTTVFKCTLKIDPALAAEVKMIRANLDSNIRQEKAMSCIFMTALLCCTSNENKKLLDSNSSNCLPQTICITASVIITITALALGFGLGLGLGQ